MWVNAVATEGMLGDMNPFGDGPCRSLANNDACVPKVLPAAELEGFLAGLIVAMPPVDGAVINLSDIRTEMGPGADAWGYPIVCVCVRERERRLLLSWAKAVGGQEGRETFITE